MLKFQLLHFLILFGDRFGSGLRTQTGYVIIVRVMASNLPVLFRCRRPGESDDFKSKKVI